MHALYIHVKHVQSVRIHALSFLDTFFEPSEFLRILKFEGHFLAFWNLRGWFLINGFL